MLWPFMLWGLLLVPVVVLAYAALRGRNHGPALLMLAGLTVLLLAMTRPRAILLLPSRLETVILAIDSSGSMRANDVQPSRIELAQAAAKTIVQEQPAFVKLGVVSVAGTTNLNGITDWQVGDWAVFNGSIWQKVDNTDAVTSVNGKTGTVVLGVADIAGAVPWLE